jgi:nicotinate-nucleotide adenylyltransferase
MKIGLFFGSFNPIHTGHLILASTIAENTDLKEIWFVISPQNPFKTQKSLLHEQDRYDMVQLAIGDDYRFKVSDIEFFLPKPSFTIDTLTHLHEKYPQHEFKLIIGGDNLTSFSKWKNHEVILDHYGLVVYPRGEYENETLLHHPNISLIEAPLLEISATFIRGQIKKGNSIKYLVPQEVETLIRSKQFYS